MFVTLTFFSAIYETKITLNLWLSHIHLAEMHNMAMTLVGHFVIEKKNEIGGILPRDEKFYPCNNIHTLHNAM